MGLKTDRSSLNNNVFYSDKNHLESSTWKPAEMGFQLGARGIMESRDLGLCIRDLLLGLASHSQQGMKLESIDSSKEYQKVIFEKNY